MVPCEKVYFQSCTEDIMGGVEGISMLRQFIGFFLLLLFIANFNFQSDSFDIILGAHRGDNVNNIPASKMLKRCNR